MALESFNEAIRLKPKYAAAYKSRGMLFFFNEHYNEALADINSTLKYYPKSKHDDFLFEMRATSNYMVGNFYDAIDDFSIRIKKSPFAEGSYISRGRAYRKIYDYEKAIADFSKAIMIEPESEEAYKFRSLSYFELGNYDKAIADYSELIRLRQQYYATRSTFQYVDLSDPYRGIMHSERRKLAYIYYHRGDAYYGNGDTENANSDYSEANKIAPFVCGCNVVELARDWDCDVKEFFKYWLRKSELQEIMERK
jgi:tetratricopeptide (TPR) repeat protein